MTRQLLRDGAVVDDEWVYLKEAAPPATAAITNTGAAPAAPPTAAAAQLPSASALAELLANPATHVILPFEQWQAERERWLVAKGNLGVVLQPVHRVEDLAPDLARFTLVAAEFPGPSDGRGYTQARLLRERYSFRGELRAAGYVRYDQLFFLARCGFNAFELPAAELTRDFSAFKVFSARYQPSNDSGLAQPLKHR